MNAKDVKELRDRTGAGILDCKKALEESKGNVDEAIRILRKKGIAKAEKKQHRIAAEGLTYLLEEGNKTIVIELNSETDFVAKNDKFKTMIAEIAKTLINSDAKTAEEAMDVKYKDMTIKDYIIEETSIIGEKLNLRRFIILEKNDGEIFGNYIHMGGKISTSVLLKGDNEEAAKNIAMQVTAMSPKYLSEDDVPSEFIESEKEVVKAEIENEAGDKPENIKEKMVEGKLRKAFKDIVLLDQLFIDDEKKTVANYLKENKLEVIKFVRYEVGEGMEKRQDDFAKEVMEQMN